MRIALAQVNSILGDFETNKEKIIEFACRARDATADIVVFPEATLFGYHPMDLLERHSIVDRQNKTLKSLIKNLPSDILVVFGAFMPTGRKKGKPYYNAAIAAERGDKIFQTAKTLLPTYGVFDDARHIEAYDMQKGIFRYRGKKILITVCEDIWAWPSRGKVHARDRLSFYPENPIKTIKKSSADLVLNLSASPYHEGKASLRKEMVKQTAKHFEAPMVYVNMVGGQDELIFDGGSFAADKNGKVIAQNAFFKEDINIIDTETNEADHKNKLLSADEKLTHALVLGIQDFVRKTNHKKVHLGISGGIDSAVVAALATRAVGAKNVTGFALPGPYSSDLSHSLARELCENLKVEFHSLEIKTAYDVIKKEVHGTLGERSFGLPEENLQARLRALMLMSYANREMSLLLNTTNKSEMSCGYGTLYGDLCGAICVIGDLSKAEVYRVAKFLNRDEELIPQGIIDRAPSAELAPDQKDEDSLPPYSELDQSVVRLVENCGVSKNEADKFLLDALRRSEYKRWQAAPILKVRERSFGRGRRMPIAYAGEY